MFEIFYNISKKRKGKNNLAKSVLIYPFSDEEN
jgi:hypothetical protein